jgi:hypothetical protein
MNVSMSQIAAKLMEKAEFSGNYQALSVDFGDGRATEFTHPLPPHQNTGGQQHGILINPVDRQTGLFQYGIYDRQYSEAPPMFAVDEKELIQLADEAQLAQFIDDVWNYLTGRPHGLKSGK